MWLQLSYPTSSIGCAHRCHGWGPRGEDTLPLGILFLQLPPPENSHFPPFWLAQVKDLPWLFNMNIITVLWFIHLNSQLLVAHYPLRKMKSGLKHTHNCFVSSIMINEDSAITIFNQGVVLSKTRRLFSKCSDSSENWESIESIKSKLPVLGKFPRIWEKMNLTVSMTRTIIDPTMNHDTFLY